MVTYNRDKEVENFLNSLKSQIYKNFELIIVDQNQDDRVYKIVKIFENEIEIKYFKANFKGLSKARNYGLEHISGNIVAFPDDDCEYPDDLLFNVKKFFESNDFDVLSTLLLDRETKREILNRWIKKSSKITPINILRSVTSATIFIKISKINIDDIYFDEDFGLGSIYPSAEEMDLIITLLNKKAKGFFNRNLYIYHPNRENTDLERVYNYSIGMGAFFRKHLKNNFLLALPLFENFVLRPIGGIFLNAIKLNKKGILKNYLTLIGRWKGFISYDPYRHANSR